MKRTRWILLAAGALLSLGGCRSADVVGTRGLAPADGEPVRTDAASYVLREQGSGLATEIRIRFRNQATRTIAFVNCHGALAPALEKKVGDSWETYWSPALLMCLSPPIQVQPGAELDYTVRVWGALPGTNQGPAFRTADVAGTYRIVLHNAVFDYDDRRPGFGEPVPLAHRVSNEFTLTR